MFSTAHLTSGIAVGLALGLDGLPLALFIGASVLTDWDYVFQLVSGRNHRTFITHSPLVVAAALGLVAIWQPLALWVLAGSMLHFLLDVWEYGLRLNPFSREAIGLKLIPGIEGLTFRRYLSVYFGDPRFLAAEIVFGVAAIALVLARFLMR